MEAEYKIFQKGFNKVLDLIGYVDENAEQEFVNLINLLPDKYIEQIKECEDFEGSDENFNVEVLTFVNSISVDITRNKPYRNYNFEVYRFFDRELFPSMDENMQFMPFEPIKIFSFRKRNTPVKQEDLKFFFEEENGKMKFVGTNDKTNGKAKEIEYEVFVALSDKEYFLMSTLKSRGVEIYTKKKKITFDELYSCAEDEDDYDEDLEIEFDPDFDL